MLYAVLCYNDEDAVYAWSKEEDGRVMEGLAQVQARWAAAGKLGPSARLLPTTAATTIRKSPDTVIDGPFAETKEQFLGFYLIDVGGLDEALAFCRDLAGPNPTGAYEVRPVGLYNPDPRQAEPAAAVCESAPA